MHRMPGAVSSRRIVLSKLRFSRTGFTLAVATWLSHAQHKLASIGANKLFYCGLFRLLYSPSQRVIICRVVDI